jgi:superfamily II DNA or RNA helicase
VLAHTMGLGKTMQVITCLMAVVQAAQSDDETVSRQIPQHLRKSRSLILCPPTLMLNWQDEILQWDSKRILGEVRLVGSNPRADAPDAKVARITHIEDWSREGGILIMGYKLFPRLLDELSEKHCAMLLDRPGIVVVDEAHNIKNIKSKIRLACTRFSTRSRIALTGSPLSNNVTEYYSMIDWVAPQYMGPHKEFHNAYALPIETGLWKDCAPSQTRMAHVLLQVLRKTISPKVHRATIQALKGEFPDKKEFVITIPVTPLQKRVYNAYVDLLLQRRAGMSSSMTFGALDNLQLVLTHPSIFLNRCQEAVDGSVAEDPADKADMDDDDGTSIDRAAALPAAMAKRLRDMMVPMMRDSHRLDDSWRIKHVERILEESARIGDKVLVFSQRLKVLDFIASLCRLKQMAFYRLDGNTKMETRVPTINKFNETNECGIFLISTRAGGVGLNIHSANRVVLMDFSHNPMHELQGIGRAYRIGQRKPVFVYWFVAAGTFEEKMHGRSVYKRQLADRVVDDMKFKAAGELDPESWIRPVSEDSMWDSDSDSDEDREGGGDRAQARRHANLKAALGKDAILDKILQPDRGVNKVITTDTFQIEMDPEDVALTAEEHKQVDEMIQLEKARHGGVPSSSALPPVSAPAVAMQQAAGPPAAVRTPLSSQATTPATWRPSQTSLDPRAPSLESGRPPPGRPAYQPGQNGAAPEGYELFAPSAPLPITLVSLPPVCGYKFQRKDANVLVQVGDDGNRSPGYDALVSELRAKVGALDWFYLVKNGLADARPLETDKYADNLAIQISRTRRDQEPAGQLDAEYYALLAQCIRKCPRLVKALVCQAVSVTRLSNMDRASLDSLCSQLSSPQPGPEFLAYLRRKRGLLLPAEVSDPVVPALPPPPPGLGVHNFWSVARSWNETFGEYKKVVHSSDAQPDAAWPAQQGGGQQLERTHQ